MAANYWESSQYKRWTFKDILSQSGPQSDLQIVSKEDYAMVHAYFANMLTRIGQKLLIRQKHIATSIMFFKRFYVKNSFNNTEPFLVAITCMYVAGKVDEYPYHITNVLNESVNAFSESDPKIDIPYETKDLAEFEFYLLQEMDCYLTPHHPYHPFSLYIHTLPLDHHNLQLAWYVINDMYMSDVVLCHAPHMLAIAAIFMILPTQNNALSNPDSEQYNKIKAWFIDLQIDFEEIAMITQKMLDFYAVYKAKFNNVMALALLRNLQGKSAKV